MFGQHHFLGKLHISQNYCFKKMKLPTEMLLTKHQSPLFQNREKTGVICRWKFGDDSLGAQESNRVKYIKPSFFLT
jgi:hypothetical protein